MSLSKFTAGIDDPQATERPTKSPLKAAIIAGVVTFLVIVLGACAYIYFMMMPNKIVDAGNNFATPFFGLPVRDLGSVDPKAKIPYIPARALVWVTADETDNGTRTVTVCMGHNQTQKFYGQFIAVRKSDDARLNHGMFHTDCK